MALPLIFAACNKKSNNDTPVPSYDVTLEAKYFVAEYWGNEFTTGADNYSIIIAENEFTVGLDDIILSEGSYYCLDIYAPATENGKLPAGTYRFDMSESCAEWTIDGTMGGLIKVDANGNFITDEEGIPFSDATLVIKEGYAELTAVIEGKTHFVTYTGKFAHAGDIIPGTTLTEDVEIENNEAMFLVVAYDGIAQVVAVEDYNMSNGAAFILEVALAEGSDSITGTYSVADGTLSAGKIGEDTMGGSWYFNLVDGDLGDEYAAIQGGSVTFVHEGLSCQMILNGNDVEGNAINATLSGIIMTEEFAPEALLKRLHR